MYFPEIAIVKKGRWTSIGHEVDNEWTDSSALSISALGS